MVPGEGRAVCRCHSGSGVQVGSSSPAGRGSGSGQGQGAGIWSHRVWQQVWDATPCLGFCFMLALLRIAGRGCPVVVYRCFGEGFVSFCSCTCLYKSIYTYTFVCIHICVCGRRAINLSPYPDEMSPRMQSRVSS